MSRLKDFLKKNFVISAKEAISLLNYPMQLYRLQEQGEIQRVGPSRSGYYSLPHLDEATATLIVLAQYYPQCVITGETCLGLYQLSQHYLRDIEVDIPKTTNLKNALFKIHRVSPQMIFEVEKRKFESVPVELKIYSPERALFEAYKFGDRSEVYFRALKRYRSHYLDKRRPGPQYDRIKIIDKKLKARILRDLVMEDVRE